MVASVDQARVQCFVSKHDLETTPEIRLLDLMSELGELAGDIIKGSSYGRRPVPLGVRWADELGDAYFSLLCLACSTGVDLSAQLTRTLNRYEDRIAGAGHPGSRREG